MRRAEESYKIPAAIEEVKEKSRHQIFADGGNQRSTRKT
jgi:hypothetical protein